MSNEELVSKLKEAVRLYSQAGDTINTRSQYLWLVEEARGIITNEVIPALRAPRPRIVCLCGSTKFWRTFQEASLQETLAGKIVLSIGAATATDDVHFGNLSRDEYDRVKKELDELHLRKIDLADEVLILNVGGYIGESTSRELQYARDTNKTVRFWEDDDETS